jgi:hypothetical protein
VVADNSALTDDESLSKDRRRARASGCWGAADGIRDNLQAFLDNEAEELAAAMEGYRYLYDDFRDESVGYLYQLTLHGPQLIIGLKF